MDTKQPLTLTAGQLMELARTISARPRLTKEERAERRLARQQRAAYGSATARAKRNRALGIPEPVAGTRLLVRAAPGVRNRRRCGIDFGPSAPLDLTVSTYSSEKAEELRAATGEPVISEDEAERLLADDLLIAIPVGAHPAAGSSSDGDVAELLAHATELEARAVDAESAKAKLEGELADAQRRLTALERQLAAMKPSDGRPERLAEKPGEKPAGKGKDKDDKQG